jgi:predicted O-linked N-acetylglucosamine transferase (SPINDLY family)
MHDWIADCVDAYVERAQRHALDIEALAALRNGLRDRFAQSSLRDEKAFALDFARCIRQMVG